MNATSLKLRDQGTLWHPYTQHGLEQEFLPIHSAKDAWLTLVDGRKVLDAISSWWVTLHGHSHPDIARAIYEQALQLEHTVFAGCTHEPAILLAEYLLQAVQTRHTQLTRCFYSDNGSTAVEIALKMAFQYHLNRGVTTRRRFIAMHHAYHGDTLACMSVSARDGFHRLFSGLMMDVDFVDVENSDDLKQLLSKQADQYAALIIEPMVQGAAGMKMHSVARLKEVAELCKQAGVLLIADEVFTGFHRTGPCFAFEHAGIQPDLLCLAKGLSGGFLPLAVTLATEEIFSAFSSKHIQDAFLHGHSFTANPLACAAAIASWQILQQAETQQAITNIAEKTQFWVQQLSQHENCRTARSLGTLGVIEKHNLPDYHAGIGHTIRAFALRHGVLLRPLGAALYVLPPYRIQADELDHIYKVIQFILEEDF